VTHVVTGGAGKIGSHLVAALVARGEKVRVIDNFSRGSMKNLPVATGQVVVKNLNLGVVGIPLLPEDVVWHLAASKERTEYETLLSNLRIDCNVIESVRKQKPRLFIYAGTVASQLVRHLYVEYNVPCVIVEFSESGGEAVETLLGWYDFMLTPQTLYEGKYPQPFIAYIGKGAHT